MSRRQRRTRDKQARHAPSQRVAASGGLALAVSLLSGSVAEAATLHVESAGDTQTHATCNTGDGCTLRDALTNAGDGDTIVFNSSLSGDTITVSSDLPTFSAGSLTIDGSGAPGLAVGGDYNYGLFDLDTTGSVSISHLRLVAARASYGSAVDSRGTGDLQLSSMDIEDNGGSNFTGGAVRSHGPLTITDSVFSTNYDYAAKGGAVSADYQLTIRRSSFHRNQARSGGAISASGAGAVTIEDTIVDSNQTKAYDNSYGGGIYIAAANSPVTITGSTIYNNVAYSYQGNASGGGVFVGAGSYTPEIRDTVVFRDGVTNSPVGGGGNSYGPDLFGSFSTAFSLIGNRADATAPHDSTDLPDGTDPQFSSFPNPAPSSPLVDAGKSFGLTTDQRGMPRPFDASAANAPGGDGSDIGAIELQPADGVTAAPSGGSGGSGAHALPVVTAISPSGGAAGTPVGITGQNFSQATGVSFGSTPAKFVVDGDSHITAVAPSGVSGSVDVTVLSAGGTSATSAADRFTYVTTAGSGAAPGIPGPPEPRALDRIRFGSNRDRTLHDLSLHGIVARITCDPGPCEVLTVLRQGGQPVGAVTETLRKGENISVRTRLTDAGLQWLRMHPVGGNTGHLRLAVSLLDGTDHLRRVGHYRFTR